MRALVAKFLKHFHPEENTAADTLATLILAAREDAAFRARLIFILQLPPAQREPLVKTAVNEMQLRGEPAAVRAAFASLSTDDGARVALDLLKVE